jgi:hypothetical protein
MDINKKRASFIKSASELQVTIIQVKMKNIERKPSYLVPRKEKH